MINLKYSKMIILFLSALLFGCAKREEAILELDTKPKTVFLINNKEYKTLNDSVRFDVVNKTYYNLTIRSTDIDNNIWKLYGNTVSGKTKLFYNAVELAIPSIRVDVPEVSLAVLATEPGLNKIEFVSEDRFLKSDTATLNLFVFNNLLPIPVLEFSQIGTTREFQFSGLKSYDQDKNFGGKVVAYTYTIEGQNYTTPNPYINYIFQNAGSYVIALKVLDNSGEYSKETTIKINVQ